MHRTPKAKLLFYRQVLMKLKVIGEPAEPEDRGGTFWCA
jgi:hypothetical protein